MLCKLTGLEHKNEYFNKLVVNDCEYTGTYDIAEQFNEYFSLVAENLASELPPATHCHMEFMETIISNSFFFLNVYQ